MTNTVYAIYTNNYFLGLKGIYYYFAFVFVGDTQQKQRQSSSGCD